MAAFPSVLRRAREEAGFSSTRALYSGLGGRRFFRCSYKQLLNVENGRSRPSPALAGRLAVALRLSVNKSRAREFASALLETLLRDRALADFVTGALSSERDAPAPDSPLRRALRRSVEEKAVPLTREQHAAIHSSRGAFWAFTLLVNDSRGLDAAALARLAGLAPAEARRGLEALRKAGLARREGALYRCPDAGKAFFHPREKAFLPLRGQDDIERMARRKGRELFRYRFCARVSESELSHYFPFLGEALEGAFVYGRTEPGADTALVAIETVARRVLPF